MPVPISKTRVRIEDWKRNLIDLTRRNRLLFFSPGRRTTLHITGPSFTEIFQRLVVDEKEWSFYPPEDTDSEPRNKNTNMVVRHTEQGLLWNDRLRKPPKGLSSSVQDANSLNNVLRNLYRRSNSDFKERGIRTLHVTFGMLKWREKDESDLVNTPLLLIPAELHRESVNSPYQLKAAEDEVEVILNPALLVKLERDFNIKLPLVPESWEEKELQKYIKSIGPRFQRLGWEVSDDCWIGLFSFHKLVIYKDLDDNREEIEKNSIVRLLAKEPIDSDNPGGDCPEPEKLDDIVKPATSYLVTDADSSQLACIEAVKRGINLVIHGPPGTGKSQTITNLFAECIAAGKSVLFVSEKMAALEVVYKRLRNAGLGHYCLELHSHKVNKRQVIEELYRCYQESLQPKGGMSETEIERLMERQRQLNEYVSALRIIQKPLNLSAYDVLNELAGLRHIAFIDGGEVKPETLTPKRLDNAMQLSQQLARVWIVVTQGDSFPWRGCKLTSYTHESKNRILILINRCDETLATLEMKVRNLSNLLGFSTPKCLEDAEWLAKLAKLLSEGPEIDPKWLVAPELDSLIPKAKEYLKLSSKRQQIVNELNKHFNERFFDTSPSLQEELSQAVKDVRRSLARTVKDNPDFVTEGKKIRNWIADTLNCVDHWEHDISFLGDLLGTSLEYKIADIPRMVKLATLCSSESHPEPNWMNSVSLREVQQLLADLRDLFKTRSRLRENILAEYDESILSLPLEEYAENLSTRYASLFRWLRPGFHRMRSSLRACQKNRTNSSQMSEDILCALELTRIEEQIETRSDHAKAVLGIWYQGYDTDFAGITKALEVAKEILELVHEPPSQKLAIQACQAKHSPQLKEVATRLEESLALWEQKLKDVENYLPLVCIPDSRLSIRQTFFLDITRWLGGLARPLSIALDHMDAIAGSMLPGRDFSPAQVIDYLENLAEIRNVELRISQESDKLKHEFGNQFKNINTDWNKVLEALEWTRKFRRHLGNRPLPEALLWIVGTSRDRGIPKGDVAKAIDIFNDACKAVIDQFDEEQKQQMPQPEGQDSSNIQIRFDNIDSLRRFAFVDIHNNLTNMLNRIDDLRDWVDFKAIEEKFNQQELSGLFTELIRHPVLEPKNLPDIAQKTLLEAWVNWLFTREPALGQFRAENQEALINEFRDLDSKHCKLGAVRVILEAERRKPKALSLQRNSEAGILVHEANKKKRHLPIRSLFSQMPNLLTQLKPCLLMSPLTVSQFLNPRQINFDLVVFDEASQIHSWDAIGAIYRGRQLVVCGDSKQLPPTTFFDEGLSDDFDGENEGDEMSSDIFYSVLDECHAVGMPQRRLRWHYRSHHESLIAFSNRKFYEDELVTFPSSLRNDSSQGVQFVYVKDGVYDRGGKRNNSREAEEVVKLVEQHMNQNPTQSLGVVAFSVSQMEAIQDQIELLLRNHPELEKYFDEDRLEGFFIKNLENVQGDERDVMIFSIGYGKDQNGRLTMNFGPLNKPGGERRLNVAITRARLKNIIVSSITARDFDLSATQAAGVLHLYHYLDYAERGPAALELRVPSCSEDCESPLERDVAGTIREMGYEVLFQVGCGKFRIDIGVIDPAEPGRFILGVECDGATYHSAYTARDRDRLRQQVLENLGWRIYRVWSPEWVSQREKEIKRLRGSIEQARASAHADDQNALMKTVTENPEPHVVIDIVKSPETESVARPASWIVPYEVCSPPTAPPRHYAFHDEGAKSYLMEMLKNVLTVEAPLHTDLAARRIAKRWDLQKVGHRMTSALKTAISELQHKGIIHVKGDFLWKNGDTICKNVRQPDPNNPDSYRSIEHIPEQELQLAIECLVRDALSIPAEQLISQVAKTFGFDRTGENIRQRVTQNIRKMIKDSRLILNEDRLTTNK